MSLTDLEQQLQALLIDGELTFPDLASVVGWSLGGVLEPLPPVTDLPLTGAKVDLVGTGSSQQVVVTGSLAWGLISPTGATITVTDDPTTQGGYCTGVSFAAPTAATVAIPGVPWFTLGSFEVGGSSLPAGLLTAGLAVQADVWVQTTLTVSGQTHPVPVPIRIGADPAGVLMVSLDTAAVVLPSINDVLAAFGGSGKEIQLPSTVDDLVSLSLEELTVGFDPSVPTLNLIGVLVGHPADGSGWEIIPGCFTLDSWTLGLTVMDPLGTPQVGGLVTATGALGSVDIGVAAVHPAAGGWRFSGYLGKEHGVPIGELVSGLGHQFGVTLPDALSSFTLNDFEFSFDATSYAAAGQFSVLFDVNGTDVDLTVTASLAPATPNYDLHIAGDLLVGDSHFDVTFDEGRSTSFAASWSDDAHPLEFADLATRFGFTDVPQIPASLDLQVVRADIDYNFTTKALVIDAVSKTYGDAAFVALNGAYVFGLRVGATINLSNLPLLKTVLGPADTVGITDLQVLVTSAALDATAAAGINALLGTAGMPQVPKEGLAAGVALSMTFQAGSYAEPLTISTGDPAGQAALLAATAAAVEPATAQAATGQPSNGTVASSTSSDGTVWYSLQKQFGPVTFSRVGIRYQKSADGKDGVLFVLMDAGLDAGGLTIAVLGLGVGSPLTTFSPHFTIDGIAVSLAEGPLTVSGGMIGTIDPHVDFYGEIVLGFTELTISALGGYADLDGHPSFFLYAVVDYPIGGPPFFFVTGIAAGLGFNRSLVIPDITGVSTFPLVAWAMGVGAPPMDPGGDVGEQVRTVMTTLASSGVIAPSLGSYWLALGVRFTSFEIVDAFVLLTVTFGTRFEVDVLGLATLSIPPADPVPIARAELALKASFAPSEGVLSIEAQLTNNSYLLDPAAHLTGGFAFYAWFAGEHAGDFVISLGGYNPNFTVPSYYPKVPRLGLSWQVIPGTLTISGDLYFTLTSNAVMAGGQLSAVWQSGPIKAWFTVWADFLMVFKPFHYYISAGIDLGASFSFKLLFVRITLTIHVGVSLELWGPSFAGTATVHLYIVSFTVAFGGGAPSQDTTLPWHQFVDQMLPTAPAATSAVPQAMSAVAAQVQTTDPDVRKGVVVVSVTRGLTKTLAADPAAPSFLVDAELFQCQVTCSIPLKAATWSGLAQIAPDAQQPHDAQGHLITPDTTFTGGVSGISAADFTPSLAIGVTSIEDSQLYGVRVLQNAPKALWEAKSFSNGVPQVDPATGLTDTTISDALVGFVLLPEPPNPDHTLPVPQTALQATLDDVEHFGWSTPTYATTDDLAGQTVAGSITASGPSGVRSAVLAAMAGQSLAVATTVDVASLADPADDDLAAQPVLRLLGEQR